MEIGMRVRILPQANYCNRFNEKTGEIACISGLAPNKIGVKIKGSVNRNSKYGCYWFDVDQLEFLESEEKAMLPNYTTASVRFPNGTNTDKLYSYALYDDKIQPGDTVVVKTGHHGLAVAEVAAIGAENAAPVKYGREIVSRVDLSAFEERRERGKKIAELKKQMDSKVQELQQEAIYEMLAQKDEGLAKLLTEYQQLNKGA